MKGGEYLIKLFKENLIIFFLLISLICVINNDFYNVKLKKHYQNLYNVEMFNLTENLMKDFETLKNEINSPLASGKINSKKSIKIKEISEHMYYTYMQLRERIISNSLYAVKKHTLPKVNIFYQIKDYSNYLQLTTDSANNNELILNSDDLKSINTISDICTDASSIFKVYKNHPENPSYTIRDVIMNEEWLRILSDISGICDKYSNLPDIFTNYKSQK